MKSRHDPSTQGAVARSALLDEPCSCRKVELRFHERSKRERSGYVHSRKYCGPDRRVNGTRGGFFWTDARDQRT